MYFRTQGGGRVNWDKKKKEAMAHGHQVVNFFHLVMVLASVKQLRKCASGTVI